MGMERASRRAAAVATLRAHDAWRPLALAAVALVSIAGYLALHPLAPAGLAGHASPVALLVVALGLPYALACWLLLAAPGPRAVSWRRVEWGVLISGALLFRLLVLPLPPLLSPDAYRYLWDAQVTAHGFSPYLHGPAWPGFSALRDPRYYAHVPWPQAPTIYPPVAQALFRLAYAIVPHNVWAIKTEMVLFDLLAGAVLMLLLLGRGQDPRRAFIALWAPLPVVEFALNGHVDAAAIAFTLLALLASQQRFRGARTLAGVLLGIATLIKLYPIVCVVAIVRRRDWALWGALGATVLLGYAPFWRDGLAATGFLSTYLTQMHNNYGGALLLIRWVAYHMGLSAKVVQLTGAAAAMVGLGGIAWLRARASGGVQLAAAARPMAGALRRLRALDARLPGWLCLGSAAAMCACIVLWLAVSPHVFPWYTTALLPFSALFLGLPARRTALALGVWSICCMIPLAYVAFEQPALRWLYPATYLASIAVALGALAAPRLMRARPGSAVSRAGIREVAASLEIERTVTG